MENKKAMPKKDRIMIGGWTNFGSGITDEAVKTFAQAGLDFMAATGEYDGYEDRKKVLDLAEKYGVEVTFHNFPIKPAEKDEDIPSDDLEFYNHPAFYGHHIKDEPGSDQFPDLAKVSRQYQKRYPGKVPFYNLLPMYANAAQLKYGASAASIEYYDSDKDVYRKHVEMFAKMFDTHYICTDIYPMRGGTSLYGDYCKSMDIFASVCRQYDRDFWLYIQSLDLYKSGIPDEANLRWQCYTALSFGVKNLIHFTYGSYNHLPNHKNWSYSLVYPDNKPTPTYYAAQKVNNELHAISDVYVQYKNLGAFNLNCTDQTDYLRLEKPYEGFDTIKSIDADQPLLVGCFDKKDGSAKAFTLVNMTNIITGRANAKVTFTLDKPAKVTAYPLGEACVLTPDANGVYTVDLEHGQGVFITVE